MNKECWQTSFQHDTEKQKESLSVAAISIATKTGVASKSAHLNWSGAVLIFVRPTNSCVL